jgi:anti-sigma B factor antagonist
MDDQQGTVGHEPQGATGQGHHVGGAPRLVVAPEQMDFEAQDVFDQLLVGVDPTERIVVDCAGVAFMDSSGLNALLTALRRQEDGGGELRLRDPSPAVARLLGLTGLEDHFGLPRS